MASPQLVMQEIQLEGKHFHVVRDDLLIGGTKQRGLFGLLQELGRKGSGKFAYASPFCGFAQIALSYLCGQMGFECILFCERDNASPRREAHAYSVEAERFGAQLRLFDSLEEAHLALEVLCANDKSFQQIPLGFDCPEFTKYYSAALRVEWEHLLRMLGRAPRAIWLPVGSGTLTRNFLQVLEGTGTIICAVDVHVLAPTDPRIQCLSESPRVKLFSAPMGFHQSEKNIPPFPANPFYDAKLGSFVTRFGSEGDVWWNVAR